LETILHLLAASTTLMASKTLLVFESTAASTSYSFRANASDSLIDPRLLLNGQGEDYKADISKTLLYNVIT
jgi:hypothetical protein